MGYLREEPLTEENFPPFAAIKSSFGFIPNFYRAQSLRPDLIAAEERMVDAMLVTEGALPRKEKEYLFLVCSAANLSTHCVTAHCEIVRMLGIEGPEPEQIALDYASTDLPMRTKALLGFATKLNSRSTTITRQDVDALRTFGYTDNQILEAVLMVGLAKWANTIAFGLGTLPDFDSIKVAAALGAGEGG